MRKCNKSGSLTFPVGRFLVSILLVLLVVVSTNAGIRNIEISSYIQPSPAASSAAAAYFPKQFRYGGGVVPRGTAEFLSPANEKLGAGLLTLVILDKSKFTNDLPCYDAIGIQWNGTNYQLTAENDLIYPLMKFIQRGSYIAYTVPMAGVDKAYFEENALLKVVGRNSYAAKEFSSSRTVAFLSNVDIQANAEDIIPKNLKAAILKDVNRGNGLYAREGSYVNSDFHVKYKVLLHNPGGKNVADVGGLPLVYVWDIATDGTAIVSDVMVFKFPKDESGLQYKAVLFFQTAAILRQFNNDNKPEFDRFLREVSNALGRP